MEALAEAILDPEESGSLNDVEDRVDQHSEVGAAPGSSSGFKRNVLKRGIFKAANMQDKLLEKCVLERPVHFIHETLTPCQASLPGDPRRPEHWRHP
jgi:hypothetical protein